MSDAADDAYEAYFDSGHMNDIGQRAVFDELAKIMADAGCRPCTSCPDSGEECLVCHDLGWLDCNEEPTEP